MLSDDELNEYVANVLKDRANKQAAAYSQLGFRAFLKNADRDGPIAKPNIRFLKNVVREVDGHNRALTRKEEKEARERLRELSMRTGEKLYGWKEEYTRPQDDDGQSRRKRGRSRSPSPRRRSQWYDDSDREHKRRRRRDRSGDEHTEERRRKPLSRRKSRDHGESDDDRSPSRGRKRDELDSERRHRFKERHEEKSTRRERRHHHMNDSDDDSPVRGKEYKRWSKRDGLDLYSSRHGRQSDRHRHRKPGLERRHSSSPSSPEVSSQSPTVNSKPGPQTTESLPESPGSIGPEIPIEGPKFVRAKGRGRMNGGTLDAKFAKDYDPRTDVNHSDESEEEDDKYVLDDWSIALRALKERQAYALSGAMTDRLAETQLHSATAAWPTYSKGEREWDKGKVILDDGSVGIKVWGVDKSV